MYESLIVMKKTQYKEDVPLLRLLKYPNPLANGLPVWTVKG